MAINVTKPFKFIGFGAINVTKPYKFIGFGAINVTKPYKFIRFGAINVTKAAAGQRCMRDQEVGQDLTSKS